MTQPSLGVTVTDEPPRPEWFGKLLISSLPYEAFIVSLEGISLGHVKVIDTNTQFYVILFVGAQAWLLCPVFQKCSDANKIGAHFSPAFNCAARRGAGPGVGLGSRGSLRLKLAPLPDSALEPRAWLLRP